MMQRIVVRSLFGAVLLAVGAVLVTAVSARGQSDDYYRLVSQYQRPQIYYEGVVVPGLDETGHFGLTFRIPHSALVFTKTPRENPRGGFVAEVEVAVEIVQKSDPVETRVHRTEHYVSSYEATQSRTEDLTGALWFDLPPGDYQYRLEITDRNTESSGGSQQHRFTIPEAGQPAVYAGLMASGIDTTTRARIVQLYNRSGDVEYGERAIAVVPLRLPDEIDRNGLSVHYVLRQLPDDTQASLVRRREGSVFRPAISALPEKMKETEEEGAVVRRDTVSVEELMPVGRVSVPESSGTDITFGYSASQAVSDLFAFMIDLEGKQLRNHLYSLEVGMTGDEEVSASHTTRFAVHWRNMPASLYDLEVAIDHLSFMADQKTLEWIREDNNEERFRTFWNERDPTPDTPFNPLMAEYYHRVDDAADKFRTGRTPAPDGLRSDRARIYIVNGPPSSKERTIPQRGIVRETWTYADGRTYVFEANSGFDTFELVDEES